MHTANGFLRLTAGLTVANGLAFSASWTEVDAGLPRSPMGPQAVVVDPSSPYTVDPNDSSLLYAIAHGTVLKSKDWGKSWSSTGFGLDSASTLAIDPQNTSTLYALTDRAIFKTTDGGTAWIPKTSGLPTQLDGYLAIDASSPSTIYLNGNGLYKSTDGGESWRALVTNGFCKCPVAIDPAHPSTLYATYCTPDNLFNLYKSTDGGDSWTAANTGVPGFVTSLVVDPASTIYAPYLAEFRIDLGD